MKLLKTALVLAALVAFAVVLHTVPVANWLDLAHRCGMRPAESLGDQVERLEREQYQRELHGFDAHLASLEAK